MDQQFLPGESFYGFIIRNYHGEEAHKRKKTVLFQDVPKSMNEVVIIPEGWNPASVRINIRILKRIIGFLTDQARIFLIFRLISYLYIRPFLRMAFFASLILFRFYHFHHPEVISARLNESALTRVIWSNYYINPSALIIPAASASKATIKQHPLTGITDIKPILAGQSPSSRNIQYHTYSNNNNYTVVISNSSTQVVFYNVNSTARLMKPPTLAVSSLQLTGKHPVAHSNNALTDKNKKIVESPIIKPMQTKPQSVKHTHTNNFLTLQQTKQQKQKHKPKPKHKPIKATKSKNTKNGVYGQSKTKTHTSKNGKIRGYIIPEYGIAMVYENGRYHAYAVSQQFLDAYFDKS